MNHEPSKEAPPSSGPASDSEAGPSIMGASSQKRRRIVRVRIPFWLQGVPFFLSALLFLSGFFSVFTALPFQVLALGKKWKSLILALVLNTAWVWVLGGSASVPLYFVFAWVPGWVLVPRLLQTRSISRAWFETWVVMVLAGISTWGIYSRVNHLPGLEGIEASLMVWVDRLVEAMGPEAIEALQGEMDLLDWKRSVVMEIPSTFLLFGLIQIWVSLSLLVRSNPGGALKKAGVAPDSIQEWRAPDFFIWPLIVLGGLMVFPVSGSEFWVHNALRIVLGVYAIQGVVVLGSFMDTWGIRGFYRGVLYLSALLFMLPLLMGVGVFDLWFDFRKNLRQST